MCFMKQARKMLHDTSAEDMADLQVKIDSDVRLAATKLHQVIQYCIKTFKETTFRHKLIECYMNICH
jgi:hypothetical protein